jgi:hypothetical protein
MGIYVYFSFFNMGIYAYFGFFNMGICVFFRVFDMGICVFRLYMRIGGMPQAVETYIETIYIS